MEWCCWIFGELFFFASRNIGTRNSWWHCEFLQPLLRFECPVHHLGYFRVRVTRFTPLNLTAKAPENLWLEDEPFLLGRPIFRCELLVSGRISRDSSLFLWPTAASSLAGLSLWWADNVHRKQEIQGNHVHQEELSPAKLWFPPPRRRITRWLDETHHFWTKAPKWLDFFWLTFEGIFHTKR